MVFACALEHIERLCPTDRCPPIVHPELGVNVIGVATQGVQGHPELTGDVRATQVGSEQPQYVKLTRAQWLDQRPGGRKTRRPRDRRNRCLIYLLVSWSPCPLNWFRKGGQKLCDITGHYSARQRLLKQLCHG